MPEYLAPGVYIEELPFEGHPIEGVSTSTAGFIGLLGRGPVVLAITSFADFERSAGPNPSVDLALAMRGFFENGGQRCYLSGVGPTDPLEAGLEALASENVSIVCCPDERNFPNAAGIMAAYCEKHKDRMCILQSPQPVVPDSSHQVPVHSSNAAYYYPWLTVTGLDGVTAVTIPPGGHIAGMYARTDSTMGVWKAPAGVPIIGVKSLSTNINTTESDVLTSSGINVVRSFPNQGVLVWSARTTSEDPEWRYVNVRRLLIFIEQSLRQGLQWAVLEPNGPALWENIRAASENFVSALWRSGALMGHKPEEAYFVRCDQTTMSQTDIEMGRVVVILGIAPIRPQEFINVRITCQTQASSVSSRP